jgi:hypothetical protein
LCSATSTRLCLCLCLYFCMLGLLWVSPEGSLYVSIYVYIHIDIRYR